MANRIRGITVEIDGDTTKLQTALKGVNSSIKSTQQQLKDVEKLLKLDPTNTELLAQKQKLLTSAVGETKEKLDTLKTAAEQANTALANGEISQEQYDALQREIVETEQELKKLEEQANQSATALEKIAATGEKLQKTGDSISSAGEKLLPVTAGVAALGTAAVTTAASFESSMSQVQATMGTTKDAVSDVNGQSVNTMDTLSELAKKMGSETAFSASECAEALNYLALAGYNTQEMCDTLPTVLNLAAAGDIDLAEASDMVTDAMSALGLQTSDADTMVDQMAKTASSTNTSVAQLGEGILKIGATAKSVRGGTAELNTALGILANNGIKGAEGGTHLRNVILSLQQGCEDGSIAVGDMSVAVYDSEGKMRSLNDILGDLNTSLDGMTDAQKNDVISKIFNKTDLAAVNSLLANTGDTWDDLQSAITNSAGAAQQMADTQLDNLEGQITILKSALEGLAISFGELLLPTIKSIVEHVQNVVNWLNSLDEGTKNMIVTVALVAAAIGPVLIIVGKVISAVGTIMTLVPKIVSGIQTAQSAFSAFSGVLAANPIALVIAAITALVAAFIYLWNTNEGFRQFWITLWETIQSTVVTVVDAISTFLSSAWEAIKTTAETAWNGIKDFFTVLWNGIQLVFTTVVTAISTFLSTAWNGIRTTVSTVWNAISTFITSIWNGIKTTITTVMNTIKNLISTGWNTIKNTVTSVGNGIKTAVTTVWNNITSAVKTAMGHVFNAVRDGFLQVKNHVTGLASQAFTWGRDVIMGIVNGIKSCVSAVGEAAGSVAGKIRSFLHFSVPDEGPLTDYESWMPDFIRGLAEGIDKSRSLIAKEMEKLTEDMSLEGFLPDMSASLNVAGSGISTEAITDMGSLQSMVAGTISSQMGELSSTIREMSSGSNTGNIVIPVYIGQERIDELVVKANNRTNFRSGGR